MKDRKKTFACVLKGLLGGAFIAAGSFWAIDMADNNAGYAFAATFIIIGAFMGIVTDMLNIRLTVLIPILIVLFVFGRSYDVRPAVYVSLGALMYAGCILALPEDDAYVNAVTGASAAAGFLAAVLLIM